MLSQHQRVRVRTHMRVTSAAAPSDVLKGSPTPPTDCDMSQSKTSNTQTPQASQSVPFTRNDMCIYAALSPESSKWTHQAKIAARWTFTVE